MKHILDIAKQGADLGGQHTEVQAAPGPAVNDPTLRRIRQTLLSDRFPKTTLQVEYAGSLTRSEESRSTQVRPLRLANPQIYQLAHMFATYEPMVYLQTNSQAPARLGMLSANFSTATLQTSGSYDRLPAIKFIPLQMAYPLNTKLLPDARMSTMLAGAVGAERAGVGSEANIGTDFEHRATILGAISLNDVRIATSHASHDIRANSSIATGLSNGRLGNLYTAGNLAEFPGYGQPVNITRESAGEATIYIPDSFLESDESLGISYAGADRYLLGAGIQSLHDRMPAGERSAEALGGRIMAIASEVQPLGQEA